MRDSFQLFVGVFDTCLVWYLLVPPSQTHAVANMTSLKAIDGDTSYHSHESLSFALQPEGIYATEEILFVGLGICPKAAPELYQNCIPCRTYVYAMNSE